MKKVVVRSGTRYDRAAFRVNELQSVGNVIDQTQDTQFRGKLLVRQDLKLKNLIIRLFGIVLMPSDNLTITVDAWSIEKDKTIGLFGKRKPNS